MQYSAFRKASTRADALDNDRIHFFSRLFSTYFAFAFFKLGFSPNQVTFLFLIVGCLAGASLYCGYGLLAYMFWRIHIILDMADGALARATNNYSKYATGFDRSNHIVINSTILIAPLSLSGSIFLANILIGSFFLYYLFSRNFKENDGVVHAHSVLANLAKGVIGLEGYVLLQASLILFGKAELAPIVAGVYAAHFLLLFLLKLILKFRT